MQSDGEPSRGGGDTEGRLHLLLPPLPPRPSRSPSPGSLPRRRRGAAAAAREQKPASERKADSPVASSSHLPGRSRGPTAPCEERGRRARSSRESALRH
ncbi:Hypothetical predicted protein [Podarcis lilfordi]|uniref:Uncharacterized protein n=1 Tax=Podarcis lilfordi TaxID=74358 RepID=A0AA35K290_9SAUR|nr:Hypothetical predicted protein [Podarcis lilfordi]